jgi:pyruvate-ferredoxin/flavodoxin oxidoreductase
MSDPTSARIADDRRRVVVADAARGVALTEGAIAQRILVTSEALALGVHDRNVFDHTVVVEVVPEPRALVSRAGQAAASGERVAVVARPEELTAARGELAAVAAKRLSVVAHALVGGGIGEALSLADLGWGVLFACGAEEASDLSLAARRACEDCGTPFLIVHERERSGAHVETLREPDPELCTTFVGAPSSRLRRADDAGHPSHAAVTPRAFAERVPFALASALRELESLTGRRHDAIERFPASEFQVAFVGLGRVGDSLVAAVERLRADGHDVGAVKVTAFRPFAGARLVKVLSRALAITVLEAVDEPLAQSNPLTRELKAAFADAITWAPDYPGVGRVPRILSGVVDTGDHSIEAHDLDAALHNMLADERGKRSFVLGHADALRPAPRPSSPPGPPRVFTMRGRVADAQTASACAEVTASALSLALGLRVRASARALQSGEGEGYAFDVVASRERPRGTHAPHAVGLVVIDDAAALLRGNPLARLADGGVVALPAPAHATDALWSALPPYAKAIVHDRGARLVGYAREPSGPDASADRWLSAAGFAGIALAHAAAFANAPLQPGLVGREVTDVLAGKKVDAALAHRGGDHARRTFESMVEVPRATIERDREGVELGRRDARATPK